MLLLLGFLKKPGGRAAVTPVDVITTGPRGTRKTTTLRDALRELSKERSKRSAGNYKDYTGWSVWFGATLFTMSTKSCVLYQMNQPVEKCHLK